MRGRRRNPGAEIRLLGTPRRERDNSVSQRDMGPPTEKGSLGGMGENPPRGFTQGVWGEKNIRGANLFPKKHGGDTGEVLGDLKNAEEGFKIQQRG